MNHGLRVRLKDDLLPLLIRIEREDTRFFVEVEAYRYSTIQSIKEKYVKELKQMEISKFDPIVAIQQKLPKEFSSKWPTKNLFLYKVDEQNEEKICQNIFDLNFYDIDEYSVLKMRTFMVSDSESDTPDTPVVTPTDPELTTELPD